MNDAVLIQCVTDASYARMIGLYYDRHVCYCADHNIDYWCQAGPVRFSEHPSWAKFNMAIAAFTMGYQYVIYLDNDAFIWDLNADLREACKNAFNLVRWEYPLSHLQAGVIYMNNHEGYAQAICSHMLEEAKYYLEQYPSLRGWFEQGQMNQLSKTRGIGPYFGELDYRWNWGVHYCPPCDSPIIKAWHGFADPEKTMEMRKELGK